MTESYKKVFEKKVKAILKALEKKPNAQMQLFIEQFFAKSPVMQLQNLQNKKAVFFVESAYQLLQKRTGKKPKIHVSSPDPKQAGFKRRNAFVQLLNDNKPFLVDSITAQLTRMGFSIIETVHPIIHVQRDSKGILKKILPENSKTQGNVESLITLEISPIPDGMKEKEIEKELAYVLDYVELAVRDWKPMLAKVEHVKKMVGSHCKGMDKEECEEAFDFMEWLERNNFVFLGYVEYDFFDSKGKEKLSVVKGSPLGILSAKDSNLLYKGLGSLPTEMRHFAYAPHLIEITKANRKSLVHRDVHMDYISIKRLDDKGKVRGECRFLGLFTSIVYYQSADRVPFIRRKINTALKRANFDPLSHNGKALRAILEFFPRDELFQISDDDLYHTSLGVLSLEATPDTRLFLRRDQYERFISCLLYMPRDKYNTFVRKEVAKILAKAFDGSISAFYTSLTDSPLARLHLIVKTQSGHIPNYSHEDIELKIAEVINYWIEGLHDDMLDAYGEKKGEKLFRVFHSAFPRHYINHTTRSQALVDIEKFYECAEFGRPAVRVVMPEENPEIREGHFNLKIYMQEKDTALSDMLPILENMGCRVHNVFPYDVKPDWSHDPYLIIRDFDLSIEGKSLAEVKKNRALLEDALVNIWCQRVENDDYNALVLHAGLDWRQVMMLRAYGKYLKQAGLSYNEDYIASALMSHAAITNQLAELFDIRFNPARKTNRDNTAQKAHEKIRQALAQVQNLAEDRIIRCFADTIQATWRTNYYQLDAQGLEKSYLSFKLNSAVVPELPLPRPYAEIFVYSLRTEGIHLRGGKVARGGLRWSDRPEDFRTEVLGLMKAQMVKNTVIVPVGSKGGFVVKHPPSGGDRDAFQKEGVFCYQQFLSGLLDVTDNLERGKIIPPQQVVRHDGDDPYLVVAADKGTATFSDIANEISQEYGFWLGDAFASGGSVGYDHKAMGITARGAWVSVERHFMEMGHDVSKEDFTVVGIGDMGGDVFGNGMLLSKHIRLVAAFNHLHIFVDPDPDAKASFKERQRLFKKPRSSWQDYKSELISKGGGVFSRREKKIKMSKEMRQLFGTHRENVTPDELIRLILRAEVDLLWNGGIGTYVKSESESHEDAGDSTNNALRVNGVELRCKVVGEGGNLGFTQRGRIEYARHGGRINTDAIDNSAGVDCSDHEVNIKIALAAAMAKKKLSLKKRNELLASMTDEVAQLVLKDNQLQTQALTIAERQAHDLLESQIRMMQMLEGRGLLNREVEYLPQDKHLTQLRADRMGLSRPELAVLMSYAKLYIFDDIVDSNFPDASYLAKELEDYFPDPMQKRYLTEIHDHKLRREIIATIITNSMVNRAGITFFHTVMEETGAKGCDIARSYIVTRDVFELRTLWQEIEALDGSIDTDVQVEMFLEIGHLLERKTVWFLRNCPKPLDIEKTMQNFVEGIRHFRDHFDKFVSHTVKKAYDKKVLYYKEKNTPIALAKRVASIEAMSSACSVLSAANCTNLPIELTGRVYYELGAELQLGWLRRKASELIAETHWEKMAIKDVINDLYDEQTRLTLAALRYCKKGNCDTALLKWYEANGAKLDRFHRLMGDIKSSAQLDVPMFMVALRQVRTME